MYSKNKCSYGSKSSITAGKRKGEVEGDGKGRGMKGKGNEREGKRSRTKGNGEERREKWKIPSRCNPLNL